MGPSVAGVPAQSPVAAEQERGRILFRSNLKTVVPSARTQPERSNPALVIRSLAARVVLGPNVPEKGRLVSAQALCDMVLTADGMKRSLPAPFRVQMGCLGTPFLAQSRHVNALAVAVAVAVAQVPPILVATWMINTVTWTIIKVETLA